jgi:pimeloyl-ACP methyl ester carboxylesterase
MDYLAIAALIVAAIIAAPFVRERFRKPVDLSKAPGSLAKLSQGITHYRWFGPDGGPMVVCVHGQTTPSDAYLAVAQKLAAKGYRVLIYDIYGRGFSSDGNGPQTRDFLVRQLEDLLADQGVTGKFAIMGYSMGGIIAPIYAKRHPERVSSMTLLVPGGFWWAEKFSRMTKIIASHPLIADWVYAVRGSQILRIGIEASMGEKIDVPEIHQIQLDQLDRRGFRYAVSSAISRDLFHGDNQAVHKAIEKAGIPVLGIWGGVDDVIPPERADVLSAWNSHARNFVVQDAGHGLPYTHSDEVVAAFETFLKETKAA